jgi:hypothetical protein
MIPGTGQIDACGVPIIRAAEIAQSVFSRG